MAIKTTTDTTTSVKLHIYQDTPNYIYLHHVRPSEDSQNYGVILYMPEYTTSESVQDSTAVGFSPYTPLSRSAPIQSYTGSGPRQVQFSFDLHRDMMQQINYGKTNMPINDTNDDYVDLLIKYIQAAALPSYRTANKMVNPPLVSLKMGSDIFITGVVSGSVGVTYKYPILANGKYAHVELAITVVEITPYDAEMVMKIGSYRIPTNLASSSIVTNGNTSISSYYTNGSASLINTERNAYTLGA